MGGTSPEEPRTWRSSTIKTLATDTLPQSLVVARPARVHVTPPRDTRAMDDDEMLVRAREDGFEFTERPVGGSWCWGFVREADERYPAFLERRRAGRRAGRFPPNLSTRG